MQHVHVDMEAVRGLNTIFGAGGASSTISSGSLSPSS